MRLFKDWLYNRLKSSYDTMRSARWFCLDRFEISAKSRAGYASSFCLFASFLYDAYRIAECDHDIQWCLDRASDWFDICRIIGPDVLFTWIKELTLLVREEAELPSFRNWVLKEEESAPWKRELIRPLVPFLTKGRLRTAAGFQGRHSVLTFLAKIPFKRKGLETDELNSFLCTEEELGQLGPTLFEEELRGIITSWFSAFENHSSEWILDCFFSNGSTSDCGSSLSKKIMNTHYLRADTAVWLSQHFPQLANTPIKFVYDRSAVPPSAKFRFVPKNALHLRGISMEPAGYNYLQSGFNDILVEYVHRELRQHIDLEHQDLSGALACRGSHDGTYATVDLSEASDRVSWSLVKAIFRDCPATLQALSALRSDRTLLPNGQTILLEKFASMGSKLCFTVETVVFAAACELACRLSGIDRRSRLSAYRVYGDDIVIRTEAYSELCFILSDMGMVVNTDKSFANGLFREACGWFCYDGSCVTTPSLPRRDLLQIFPSELTGNDMHTMVDAANECWISGHSFTRYVLAMAILRNNPNVWFISGHQYLELKSRKERNRALRGPNRRKTSDENNLPDPPDFEVPEVFLISDQPTNFNLKFRDRKIKEREPSFSPPYDRIREVRLVRSVLSFQVSYGKMRWAPVILPENIDKFIKENPVAYELKLYAFAHNTREVVQGTDLELPIEIPAGESYEDSPICTRWQLSPNPGVSG